MTFLPTKHTRFFCLHYLTLSAVDKNLEKNAPDNIPRAGSRPRSKLRSSRANMAWLYSPRQHNSLLHVVHSAVYAPWMVEWHPLTTISSIECIGQIAPDRHLRASWEVPRTSILLTIRFCVARKIEALWKKEKTPLSTLRVDNGAATPHVVGVSYNIQSSIAGKIKLQGNIGSDKRWIIASRMNSAG